MPYNDSKIQFPARWQAGTPFLSDLAEAILAAVVKHLARKWLLLKKGRILDATIIAAPSSTKNADGERDPEMHQTP